MSVFYAETDSNNLYLFIDILLGILCILTVLASTPLNLAILVSSQVLAPSQSYYHMFTFRALNSTDSRVSTVPNIPTLPCSTGCWL